MKIDRGKLVEVIEDRGVRAPYSGSVHLFDFKRISFRYDFSDGVVVIFGNHVRFDLFPNGEEVYADMGNHFCPIYENFVLYKMAFESVHEACKKLGVAK